MKISANKMPAVIDQVIPALFGLVCAFALWPLSWLAAINTAWLSVGTFADFWLGAFAIISFLGAVAASLTAIIAGGIAAREIFRP